MLRLACKGDMWQLVKSQYDKPKPKKVLDVGRN